MNSSNKDHELNNSDLALKDFPEIPHVPRIAHNYPGSKYLLPSDDEEKNRLILQHFMLKNAYDGKLFLFPIDMENSHFILDSGTGGAVWLLDAAQHLPGTAILHGLDIESKMFPKLIDSPLNLSFSVGSITSLPKNWSNRFDIIHQRMLKAALQESDWISAFNEMFRTLRPGGWVQLAEAGSWKSKDKTEKLETLIRSMLSHRNILLDCVDRIPTMLESAGFTRIKSDRTSIPLGSWSGKWGCDARDNYIGVFRGMKTPILRAGGLGLVRTEEEFDSLIDGVKNEWDETPGSAIDFCIFTAQKPEVS